MILPRDKIRDFVKAWSPPEALLLTRRLLDYLRPALWEYMPDGWRTVDPQIKGWNVDSVMQTQRQKWPAFVKLLEGNGPLGLNHEATEPTNENLDAHNLIMSYAYVVTLAARMKTRISILDWGGGLGHYYLIAKALLDDLDIDYNCRDLSLQCQAGRELLPAVTFHDRDEICLQQQYDLVFSSFSLPYSEDWKKTASELAGATSSYLYITRLPVVQKAASFVVVQRPHSVGYRTEYLGWFLNRQEFINHLAAQGMQLVREFLIREKPSVHRAPEQAVLRGFLFRPKSNRRSA